jgi:hypothetical protein
MDKPRGAARLWSMIGNSAPVHENAAETLLPTDLRTLALTICGRSR